MGPWRRDGREHGQFTRSHPGALQDGCWIPGPELSWLGGLVRPGQTPDCVLGLGSGGSVEITDPRQKGHVHAGLSASKPGKEKRGDIVKCVHTAPG